MRRIAIAVFACVTATLPLSATITGTLVNSDGQAVAGAKLSIFPLETPDATRARQISPTPDRAAIATATSDSKGKFSFESPKDPVVVLNISATGFAPAAIAVERDDERGAILLASAAMKQGRITANGKGVAGAKIILAGNGEAELLATTDAEGRYSVPDPTNWADRIAILHPDYALVHDFTQRRDNRKIDLDRTLDSGTTVAGRVVTDDGKTPLAGAAVLISDFPLAKSADDGSFTIAHAPARWQSVEARMGSVSGERARNGDGAIAIKVTRTATVNGTIRDSKTQSAVAGALIRAGAPNRFVLLNVAGGAVTDSKGSFSLSLPPGNYELTTSRPGFAIANTSVNVGANAKVTKNLVATRLARVSGSVIDENKAPVAGTRIEAGAVSREPGIRMFRNTRSTDQSGIAAPDGSFVIRVEPDADVQIEATKKGYPEARSATMRFAPGERKSGLVLTIPQGVAVAGHVVDHGGKPLAGVGVSATEAVSGGRNFARRIARFGGNRDEDNAVKTGADGRFTMRLKPGTYNLALKGDGLASKTLNARAVTASMQPIEVTMDAGAVLAGRITRAGVGVQGVSVDVFGGEDQGSAETGADGAFRITGLTPGQAMLNASKQEDFIQQFRPVTIPADNLVIDLPAGGRITGRVVEKESKQPVTAFDAGFSGARGGGGMMFMGPPLSRHFTSDDGTFVLENVPPGATNLVVNAPGYTAGRVSNVNVEDGKTVENLEVEMDRGVRVSGRVTGPDGSALSGVTVMASSNRDRRGIAFSPVTAVTDGSGEYSIDNVESGDKTFSFDRNGYLTTTKTATLSGTDARVDAQMSTGMTLTGLVVTDAGVPIADAGVSASSASDSAFGGRSTRTDANGQFEMDGLSPGRYTFRASKTGVASGTLKDFDISSGAPVRIVLQQGGVITGHIAGITADELTRAGVYAQSPNGNAVGTVDPSGSYRIEGAPSGTVRVTAMVATAGGIGTRNSPSKSVQLDLGGTAQVDLEFASGTVRGRITRDGQPSSQAMVLFSPQRGQASTQARISTDGDGNYEAGGLEDATYDVQVIDLQRGTPYSTTYTVSGSGTFNIDIKSATVRGHVLDASTGQPVGEAAIELRTPNASSFPLRVVPVTTDASGGFVLDSVPPGTYTISAEKTGYGTKAVDLTVGDSGSDIEIKIAPNAGVNLRVVDGRDGRTITAFIRVKDASGNIVYDSPMRLSSGGADSVQLPLDSGTYRATLFAQGYASQSVTIISPSTQTVPMTPGGGIAIKSSGSAMRRARLIGPDGQEYSRGFSGSAFAVDPSPGTTLLENIAPGTYTLQILNGDAVAASVQVTVVEGQIAQVSA